MRRREKGSKGSVIRSPAEWEALKRTKQERDTARKKQTRTIEWRRKVEKEESESMSLRKLPASERGVTAGERRRWNGSRRCGDGGFDGIDN